MTSSTSHNTFTDSTDPELEYREVDKPAIIGLLLGLLSPLALIDVPGWIVPVLGVLFNTVVLWRLGSSVRIGRGAALAGLALSCVFGIAPIARTAVAHMLLTPQGRPIADQWFAFLREGNPEKALQLTFVPDARQNTDDA